MELNLNFNVRTLDGKEMQPATENHLVHAGKIIATHLVTVPKGTITNSVLKHYEWAMKLNAGKVINLDTADAAYLKKFIEEHANISILIKAQVLEKFKEK